MDLHCGLDVLRSRLDLRCYVAPRYGCWLDVTGCLRFGWLRSRLDPHVYRWFCPTHWHSVTLRTAVPGAPFGWLLLRLRYFAVAGPVISRLTVRLRYTHVVPGACYLPRYVTVAVRSVAVPVWLPNRARPDLLPDYVYAALWITVTIYRLFPDAACPTLRLLFTFRLVDCGYDSVVTLPHRLITG